MFALAAVLMQACFATGMVWDVLQPAVGVVAAFHQDAPPVPRAGPLIALPVGAALIGLWTHLIGPGAPAWLGPPDLPAIYCWPFLAASGGYAVTRKVAGRLQGPGWPLGLVLMAVPVFAARVLGLVVYLGQQTGSQPGWLETAITIAVIQAALVGLATLALLVTAVRGLRRLPCTATAAGVGPTHALPS